MTTPADSIYIDGQEVIEVEWYQLTAGMKCQLCYWSPDTQQANLGGEWLYLAGEPVVTVTRLILSVRATPTSAATSREIPTQDRYTFFIVTG